MTLPHTNIKALGPAVSENKILSFISIIREDNDAPGAWPVWTPGERLAEFIERSTVHCYAQEMKALEHVVSEKTILFSAHCKAMSANPPHPHLWVEPFLTPRA